MIICHEHGPSPRPATHGRRLAARVNSLIYNGF